MGAAMGWTPSDVRACPLSDFTAAVSGFLRARGIDDNTMSEVEAQDLRAELFGEDA